MSDPKGPPELSPFCCRASAPLGGAKGLAGGSIIDLIFVVDALEQVTATKLCAEQIGDLLQLLAESFSGVRMHTTRSALEGLSDVTMPPPEMRLAVLDQLVKPSRIGCESLRSLSARPELRTGLVTDAIRAFYRELWARPGWLAVAICDAGACGPRSGAVRSVDAAAEAHFRRIADLVVGRGGFGELDSDEVAQMLKERTRSGSDDAGKGAARLASGPHEISHWRTP